MNELLEVLENEEAGYRELVEASTRKKEVIIKADIRALEEITAEEQEIAGKIKNIENKRISIMEDIANVLNRKPEDLTVDALLEILANQPKEQEQLAKIRLQLKDTLTEMKNINEQIHYTGQYLANKSIYADYRKSRNKEKFYDDHRAELTLYESALRILKEKSQGKKLPTLKMLHEEKNRLTK